MGVNYLIPARFLPDAPLAQAEHVPYLLLDTVDGGSP